MQLLDLPVGILRDILQRVVLRVVLRGTVRLRLVNKFFDREVFEAAFASRCVYYSCSSSDDASRAWVLKYLLLKIEGGAGFRLCETIRQTADLLSSQSQDSDEALSAQRRLQLIQTLGCWSIASLGPRCVLGHLKAGRKHRASSADTSSEFLAAASYFGDEALVKRLLDEGADINPGTTYFGQPLQTAASQGHAAIVRLLLDRGPVVSGVEPSSDSSRFDGRPMTALEAASTAGHIDTVRVLLEPGYAASRSGLGFERALYHSAKNGHLEVFRLLSESSERPPTVSIMVSMMFRACEEGYTEILRLLLDSGVDPNFQWDKKIDTPLAAAIMEDQPAAVQLLLERGANPMADCKEYPLFTAARFGYLAIAETVLNHDRNTLHTNQPYSPLAAAARAGQRPMVEYLLKQGADPSLDGLCDWHFKALCLATEAENKPIIQIIKNHGAKKCSSCHGI